MDLMEITLKIIQKNILILLIFLINVYLFLLHLLFIIFSFFFTRFYIFGTKNYNKKKSLIKIIFLTFIIAVYIVFEGLIIWKLVLEYKIKKSKITWFMSMDYTFLVLNLLFILCQICEIITWIKYKNKPEKKFTSLISINNISIWDFNLPDNFNTFDKTEQRKIIAKLNKMSLIRESHEMIKRIILINKKREDLGIEPLKINNYLYGFMTIEPSEPFFFEHKKIFLVDKNKYLILCNFDEFENKLNNNDEDLMKIINNINLNTICMFRKEYEDKIHIYIYDDNNNNLIIKIIKLKLKEKSKKMKQ